MENMVGVIVSSIPFYCDSTYYNLCKRTHNLTLPMDVNAVMKQNVVYRVVLRDIYWF